MLKSYIEKYTETCITFDCSYTLFPTLPLLGVSQPFPLFYTINGADTSNVTTLHAEYSISDCIDTLIAIIRRATESITKLFNHKFQV